MIVLSLFDGISAGQVALQRAGIAVEKYYASEIDKYAIQVTQKNYPNTIQLGDITKWREWKVETPDMIVGGSPCFVAGTKIITRNAIKNIEDVRVGDYVLTHKRIYKKVIATGKTYDNVFTISAQGILPIKSTGNHPFYVRKMRRKWNNRKRTSFRYFSEAE